MVQTVVVTSKETGETIWQCEIPSERFDLKEAIRKAAWEYQLSHGMQFGENGSEFRFSDFFREVPGSICRKYGFHLTRSERIVFDGDEAIISKADLINGQLPLNRDDEETRFYEIIAYMSRMWGVMETLGTVECPEFRESVDQVIEWAKQYRDSGEAEEIVKFFYRKAKRINRPEQED